MSTDPTNMNTATVTAATITPPTVSAATASSTPPNPSTANAADTNPATTAPAGINATPLAPAGLLAEAARLKTLGNRLVTLTSVELDQTRMEVLYHFDKDLALTTLRVPVAKGGRLPSISGLFFAAFLVENEIRDQFALTFDGLVLDYQGRLLNETAHTTTSSPFCRYQVRRVDPEPVPGAGPGTESGPGTGPETEPAPDETEAR